MGNDDKIRMWWWKKLFERKTNPSSWTKNDEITEDILQTLNLLDEDNHLKRIRLRINTMLERRRKIREFPLGYVHR